jgi:oxygen-independent coproporphyrinogen-3 oxidase
MSYIKHLYIHIPFCNSKCSYCDFFSTSAHSEKTRNAYSKALIRDLKDKNFLLNPKLKTIYFGGGSPALLGIENLKKIIKQLKKKIKNTEITIELNPEHSDFYSIEKLTALGINRFSIGVQTTNKRLLDIIKRPYTKNLINHLDKIKKNKNTSSLDFMFGLPTQKIKDLEKDLFFIKENKNIINHVSFYLFTPPKEYKLNFKNQKLHSDTLYEKMFDLISKELKKNKFTHYEVSNFSKEKKSIHNLAYWESKYYLGIGAGAHSYIKNLRYFYKKDISAYIKNPNSIIEFDPIDKEKRKKEKIMLGLRLLEKGLNKGLFQKEKIDKLIKNKFIIKERNKIKIKKVMLIDSIIEYLI